MLNYVNNVIWLTCISCLDGTFLVTSFFTNFSFKSPIMGLIHMIGYFRVILLILEQYFTKREAQLILCPGNLTLTVSRDQDRDRSLVTMLSEDGSLATCDSVIVYCTRREECERIAAFIRTNLQSRDILPGKQKLSFTAEPYHAGDLI